jgi:hypothetical protein
MDVAAALGGALILEPTSISFGFGGESADLLRVLRIRNLGSVAGRWKIEVDTPDATKVAVEPAEFSLGVQEGTEVSVRMSGEFAAGEYQGYLLLRQVDGEGQAEARPVRVPYWYGVPSGRAASVAVLPVARAEAEAGSEVAITVLVTDEIGASVPGQPLAVTVAEGGGEVMGIASAEEASPGYWRVRLRLGPSKGRINRFRLEAGAAMEEVSIRGR